MPFLSMEQGIKAIQAGNLAEGARLLKIALKSEQLTGRMRAVALLWLAETMTDLEQKMACYKDALVADPGNADAQNRLANLMASRLPPTAMPRTDTGPVAPVSYPPAPSLSVSAVSPLTGGTGPLTGMFYRSAGILDGPNGPGTAFFVHTHGLLATTRYVVGGVENVTVTLEGGRSLPGRVARSYPEMDVALVQVDVAVSKLLPISTSPTIPNNMRLTAISHAGRVMTGIYAATKRSLAEGWFPTTITDLSDAGGNPIFDERNYLVGMLTRNMSRTSGYVFGLHIASIQKCVENYLQEIRLDSNRVYCPNCGYLSRAASVGAFYCEVCGGVLPFARDSTRFPVPHTEGFYGETMHTRCPHCGSRLGFYNGRCLRCGNEGAPPKK